ncbi:transmembrane protein 267-like [Ruditapes philippinarum]|uniref:transmembrane protein 267-like n=1 Tax=Ruditapes philippinarum TaxID=129788 RepID=UPI00295C275D|nr:transmembrane protein 267-like [Ruditapes philippinarum]XP_060567038.1 transmembrane protein 267-like [Ruditapes philippinarum]
MPTYVSTVVLEILLGCTCYLGDRLLEHPVAKQQIVVAITDSLTHGIVGGISWAIICDFKFRKQECVECLLCMMLAMLVDVDHFIAAKSFSLKSALSLPTRPPFHATTLIVIIDITMGIMAAILKSQSLFLGLLIFTTAWISHHVRDGHRRGLWFYPFGETAPIPKFIYIGIIMILPLFIMLFYLNYYQHRLKDKVITINDADFV